MQQINIIRPIKEQKPKIAPTSPPTAWIILIPTVKNKTPNIKIKNITPKTVNIDYHLPYALRKPELYNL